MTNMRQLPKESSDLGLRGDGASGDAHGVNASVGVLVDLDVGSVLPGLDVSRRVEQVQHLLVVQLEDHNKNV